MNWLNVNSFQREHEEFHFLYFFIILQNSLHKNHSLFHREVYFSFSLFHMGREMKRRGKKEKKGKKGEERGKKERKGKYISPQSFRYLLGINYIVSIGMGGKNVSFVENMYPCYLPLKIYLQRIFAIHKFSFTNSF